MLSAGRQTRVGGSPSTCLLACEGFIIWRKQAYLLDIVVHPSSCQARMATMWCGARTDIRVVMTEGVKET